MGTWTGLYFGSPGLGAGDFGSSLLPPLLPWTHGLGQVPLTALEYKGTARVPALSPLLARGAVSRHTPVPLLGWKRNLCFFSLVTPAAGMSDPSRSAILLIWECLGETTGSPDLLPTSVPSLDTEGPLCYPDYPCPGRWPCCKVGASHGEEMPYSHLPSLQHLPFAPIHPLSCILFSQTAKHLQLPAPPSQIHQWSLQAQLSTCPKRWGAV